ncbi:MAG TPA: cytochrome c-type biogenesis protein CcmH [Rhodospirillaceae bacterium]|nr:cytochrome c-type biogenesis protein CcmH [Rhodospirillaceae bacterium]HAA92278.1 cytochrome c-type biogenesis protein CcmH [Rhodospirillaceae bacterium]HAT36103.1 cytochrome c-type biogenesis protein CcmH [Rhodospirillaceae bacterium]
MKLTAIVGLLLTLLAGPAAAVNPDEVLADPALEGRARALSVEIRCLVCQNQSIDDSDADLAKDLRKLVREKLKAGASDKDIKDYLVARYGEFILLRPPVKSDTYLLWFGPIIILLAGIVCIFVFLRRQSASNTPSKNPELSKDEEKRIASLIGEKD